MTKNLRKNFVDFTIVAILASLELAEPLNNIGYYRLSAYMYPFLKEPKTDHRFKDNV